MTEEEKKAAALREGTGAVHPDRRQRRPDQAFGDYYRGRSASCALGAAYEGMYRLPTQAGGLRPTKDLEWFFDCLEGSVRQCPHGNDCRRSSASPRSSCT